MTNSYDRDKSELYCTTIAKSISDIIRYSLDEEFRSKAYKVLESQSTAEVEAKIYTKLSEMIENGLENTTNSKSNAKDEILEKSEKESDSTPTLTSQDTTTPSTSTQESDSQSLFSPKSFHTKNWFKISSEKYKENLKDRQKIQYFSQPLAKASSFCEEKTETLKNSTQILKFSQTDWDSISTCSLSQHSIEDSDEDDNYFNKRFRKF